MLNDYEQQWLLTPMKSRNGGVLHVTLKMVIHMRYTVMMPLTNCYIAFV